VNTVRWLFPSSTRPSRPVLLLIAAVGGTAAAICLADLPDNPVTLDQVVRGRLLVAHHGCTGCHNSSTLSNGDVHRNDPSDPRWLAGILPSQGSFQESGYNVYPANLTPDKETGLGQFSARQVFNALRYGLDPADTPDVLITSTTPGEGGFPAEPHYLAPPMPWPSFRHMADGELWDIVAYLQHGIKPVSNKVKDSKGPTNHWASFYTEKKTGPYPLPPYPASNEEFQP
jgi:hypothetical protein